MKRLTTNCPDNNLDAALNLFYIKDSETWVRGGGDGPDYPDIRLYDFIRKAAKILLPDLEFPRDDDGVDYAMGELVLDGPDEPTGLLALLYTAAWSYAELRGRLMQYEDTGLEPAMCANYKTFEDKAISKGVPFKRIVALMEADKAGRLVVMPCKVGDTVYFRTYDCNGTVDLGIQPHKVTAIVGHAIVRGGYTDVGLLPGQYGVSWFLTREAAEKALEAMKNE